MSPYRLAVTLCLVLGSAAPLCATDPTVETVTVRVARPAADSPHAARSLRHHIADAALEACGASPYSAAEVKAVVARSSCWRESYADGIAQIDDGGPRTAVASLPPSRTLGKP